MTTKVLNYESVSSALFQLKIEAEDLGEPPRKTTKDLVVELVDIDDGDATLDVTENRSVTFKLSESEPVGTKIGAVDAVRLEQLEANKDGAPSENDLDITYEIIAGNSQGLFDIDRIRSDLYLVKQLDFETSSVHVLRISRIDLSRPGLAVNTLLEAKIVVLDENDNAPVFPDDPVICTIPENAPIGQLVWRYSATDKDAGANGRLVYRIVEQSPEAVFALESVTGDLWLEKALDRERHAEYLLVVEAADQAQQPNQKRVARVTARIYVTDVNDNR